jgi:sodium-independent sulfate anion transporter 11
VILVLALYSLTAIFYYIPMAALAGLIIHAVANLMTPPSALYVYWKISPLELLIWVAGVTVALFVGLETSIYTTIALSFALLLVRMARSQGGFLGPVKIHRVMRRMEYEETNSHSSTSELHAKEKEKTVEKVREVYLPLKKRNSPNPKIDVVAPYPGVFIYRFNEALNYVNNAQHMDHILSYVEAHTRRTSSNDGVPLKVSRIRPLQIPSSFRNAHTFHRTASGLIPTTHLPTPYPPLQNSYPSSVP